MKGTTDFVGGRVKDDSIWAVLHPECHVLFPDELFADLFTSTGRRSVPLVSVFADDDRNSRTFAPARGDDDRARTRAPGLSTCAVARPGPAQSRSCFESKAPAIVTSAAP